jgi:hypothetical protein
MAVQFRVGYYPSGGVGPLLVIVLVIVLMGKRRI